VDFEKLQNPKMAENNGYQDDENHNAKSSQTKHDNVCIEERCPNETPKRMIPWRIYVSRALSAWGDRIWEFAAAVFLSKLAPDNLRVVAIYGFVMCISVILSGAMIGNWIDRNQRLFAAKTFLAIQNLSVAISCAIIILHYLFLSEKSVPEWIVPAAVIIVANIANLASVGCKIVIERDWIVVVASGDENKLATMNAVFRTINLTTLLIAPAFAGLIFDFASNLAIAVTIGTWNIVSVVAEYYLLVSIFKLYPDLANKKFTASIEPFPQTSNSWYMKVSKRIRTAIEGWRLYLFHTIRNAGIALSCLYMTVLGLDNITFAYCLSQCVSAWLLGVLVGVSAVIGVTGSASFPFIRKRIGLDKTGIIGMTILVATLFLCVISIWLDGSPFDPYFLSRDQNGSGIMYTDISKNESSYIEVEGVQQISNSKDNEVGCSSFNFSSVYVLLAGMVLARFGLWISDLTITQIIQENVEEEHRGIISGVQSGMNSFMDTIKFVLVILLPYDETFGYLIIASYAFYVFGFLSYLCHALNTSKRKVYTIQCIDGIK